VQLTSLLAPITDSPLKAGGVRGCRKKKERKEEEKKTEKKRYYSYFLTYA